MDGLVARRESGLVDGGEAVGGVVRGEVEDQGEGEGASFGTFLWESAM